MMAIHNQIFSFLMKLVRVKATLSMGTCDKMQDEAVSRNLVYFKLGAHKFVESWIQYTECCLSRSFGQLYKDVDALAEFVQGNDGMRSGMKSVNDLISQTQLATDALTRSFFLESTIISSRLELVLQILLDAFSGTLYSQDFLVRELKSFELNRAGLMLALQDILEDARLHPYSDLMSLVLHH